MADRPLVALAAQGSSLHAAGGAAGADAPALPDARTWDLLFGTPLLSVAEQQALSAVARVRPVAAGDEVFGHHDAARALVALHCGDVALGFRSADGAFHVERPVHGTAWLDQSSAWLGDRHSKDARASGDAIVIELPREELQRQAELHPNLALRLVASLAREVQALAASTHELMHKDAPARFAAWLLQRCPPVDPASRRAVIRLGERKRDIASQLAITPETLSRLMRSLSRQGLISVAGYTVQVLDLPGLRGIAQTV
jgi:CRP/FNR family transcriptional regulator, dissimilatory nitrate respiration regulator